MRLWLLFVAILASTLVGCQQKQETTVSGRAIQELPDKLSDLQLFDAAHRPSAGALAYDLNTPLFSDYTLKERFIKLPAGTTMSYRGDEQTFDFPSGTIIAKTFSYPFDQRHPEKGQRKLETRILLKDAERWQGVSYVWNDEQTEAYLKLAGMNKPSTWIHFDGSERSNAYIVPNANQCKGCHGNNNEPIGPKPRNLLNSFAHQQPESNGLTDWHAKGLIQNLPATTSVQAVPIWNDAKTGTLEQRARAWLDVNCAHCHNPTGPARQSGLDLRYTQDDLAKRGFMKVPVAAGRGSGGRLYDIVPGKPDESVLVYRLESVEPGIMMPELPRRLVDVEGVKLIREWISSLSSSSK